MQVASLSLCKELFELSGGWNEVDFWWHELKDGWSVGMPFSPGDNDIPAYDLSYLLRKLQELAPTLTWLYPEKKWAAITDASFERQDADTPEDAAAKLAIELFKQGILTQDSGGAI